MEDLVVLSFQDPLKIVLLVDCLDGKLVIVKKKYIYIYIYIYIKLNTELVYINCKNKHVYRIIN